MTYVYNVNGSSRYEAPAGYASWKEFWEKRTGRHFDKCSCPSCMNRADVGGHVRRAHGTNEWYIVPICYSHNNSTDYYLVNEYDMVPVH